ERQPGGATTRGAVSVARAPADGHTLLLASNGTMVINPHYFYGVRYDPVRDFVLVAPLATMPFLLLVNTGLPVASVQGLAGWLKPRPGEINYGSSGEASTGHLAGELFRRMSGVEVVHVSYNGGLAALNALATGQVALMFAALPLALPYLGNEHFKALGISSATRFESLPLLPTLAESGLPGFEVEAWYGVFAPTRIPPAPRVWLSEQIASYMAGEAARVRLVELGLNPATASLAQFATRINSETEKWAPVLRANRTPFKGKEEG
ncbi:MAG TPA: tripartite tricarboxylate transporter substrate-binding protein, partial [Burkholderiales bacterium]|nr:tripartite tricarboxylate transporter substrate-binding protein [Burkholderiales bacterium]